jgi:pimeloyl-ACP methyl ester carboxylesterase
MGEHIRAGDLAIWTEQVDGGAGRTAMPGGRATVEAMADDAAAVLRALDLPSAHVAGFSGGSIIGQELALRHPEFVRSLVLQSTWAAPDAYLRAWFRFVHWLIDNAPDERALMEYFFLDVYTARAHDDGTVAAFIDDVVAFPHKQATADMHAYLSTLERPDTRDRLRRITAPTLVLAGGADSVARPALGRDLALLIPGAVFEIQVGEAHQPFQEIPDAWNARVDVFWQDVETRLAALPHPRAASEREQLANGDRPRS